MKVKITMFAFIAVSLSAFSYSYAQDKSVKVKQPEPVSAAPNGNVDFTVNYGYGLSYTTGDIAGDGGQKTIAGESKTFGMHLAYNYYKSAWVYFAVSHNDNEMITESNFMNTKKRAFIEAEFVDFTLASRVTLGWIYFDLGLYYGIPYGSWYKKEAVDSAVTEIAVYGGKKKNNWGLLAGTGFLLPLNDAAAFQLGLNVNMSFTASYEANRDSLKRNSMEFVTGIQYKL